METQAEHKNYSVEGMDSVLHDFLGWLGNIHQSSVIEAGESQSFLNMGIKTQFAQKVEEFLKNPIDTIYKNRQIIDTSLRNMINEMVSVYLVSKNNSKNNFISKVVLIPSEGNVLYYCISLKEDVLNNRIEINDFYDFYDFYSLSSTYPVYFQFVSDNLMPQIKYEREVI